MDAKNAIRLNGGKTSGENCPRGVIRLKLFIV